MIRYNFLKAQPIVKSEPVEDVEIAISVEIPDVPSLDEADKVYSYQAEKLEQILIDTLPGGTYDRLLGFMLARKASYFKVAYRKE